ncbi:MAG: bifunctional folylpolyglutamate synthase/dihydrofolate synthase [Acidobacteria bacterium]|nr:bifunctional folylpolyglutamate synthase/dihydrofolate synthase [Acidobacteriota bacterium]
MTYPETVRYLLSLGNEVKTAKLGLERISTLLDRLGRPQDAFPSVHIAGTNGKGSTAAMVEAGLRAARLRTGLYTSPHLVRINERVRISGEDIPDADFCAAFHSVHAVVEQLLAEERLDCHPTYFECVTAMAFEHFRRAGVERAVIEVGLGGRLDATNVITPLVAVVTPIDFDHEALLGKAAAAISAEKAGILKPGVPAVFAPQRPEAAEVLEARARELGIRVLQAGTDWRAEQVAHQGGYYRFVAHGPSGARLRAELSLAGEHQVTNALTAIAALDLVGVPHTAVEQGLRQARWPGRLEQVAEAPLILLDGAHNPAGARALARFLTVHYPGRRLWLIYAAMRDKAVEEVAGALFPLAHQVLLTRVSLLRAVSPRALETIVSHHHPHIQVTESLSEALDRARASASETDIILVTGSLFLVGEAKALLHAPRPAVD